MGFSKGLDGFFFKEADKLVLQGLDSFKGYGSDIFM